MNYNKNIVNDEDLKSLKDAIKTAKKICQRINRKIEKENLKEKKKVA